MSASGWIGVDFDGTLAEYHGWVPGGRFGDPIPAMMERVKVWLANGVAVRIVTARAADPDEAAKVQDWCERHGLPRLVITDRKDFSMIELWDDRAVQVVFNVGTPVNGTLAIRRSDGTAAETMPITTNELENWNRAGMLTDAAKQLLATRMELDGLRCALPKLLEQAAFDGLCSIGEGGNERDREMARDIASNILGARERDRHE